MAEAKEKATPQFPDMGSDDRDRDHDHDLHAIAGPFEWRTPSAVREFLDARPQVRRVLPGIPRQVKRFFGESKLILDVLEVPDDSSPPELFVCIVTCFSPDEAWNRLKELEEQWWSESAQDYPINFDVEFA